MLETRLSECRLDGGTLSGVLLPYGEVSAEFRERFVPGAFGDVGATVPINLQHDRAVQIGDGELSDGPDALRVSLEVPMAYRSLVKRGALNGFSVEFESVRESRESGVRVIESAILRGAALVDRGAYDGARVEARSKVRNSGLRVWL